MEITNTPVLVVPVVGSVRVSNTPPVIVINPIEISGLNLDNGALSVSIVGSPTVSIDQPVAVIGALDLAAGAVVSISGTPTVISGRRGFTSILLTAFTFAPISALASFTTTATDISTFNDYTYAIHIQVTGLLGALVMTPVSQVALINQANSFTTNNTGEGINLGIGNTTAHQVVTDIFLL